jgi:hypothetical protein
MKHEKNLEWGSILNALETTHNLTIREMCRILKTGRTWVTKNVVPQISDNMIYLPSHRGNSKNRINWAVVAARQLGRGDIIETKWFCRQDFYDLISRSIVSVTKQTIRLPVELFVKDKSVFHAKYSEYSNKIFEVNQNVAMPDMKKISLLNKLYQEQEEFWHTVLSEEMALIVEEGECGKTSRSKVETTHCNYDVVSEIERWVAPHDVLDYGDCDEQVYRKFFAYGYIRIELQIKGKEDKISKKVFYLNDPVVYRHQYVDEYLVFRYSTWLKYKNEILAGTIS